MARAPETGHPHDALLSLSLSLLSLLWWSCVSCGEWFGAPPPRPGTFLHGFQAQFSMESPDDPKGIQRVDNAKKKLSATGSCWIQSYHNLFSACPHVFEDDDRRQRLAWYLTDCFLSESGGRPFPSCPPRSSMKDCLGTLKSGALRTYLEFYLETSSICQELQAQTFRRETERMVNDLKGSAEFAEGRIEMIEKRSEELLQCEIRARDSLNSVDLQTQQLVQTSTIVEGSVEAVFNQSQAVLEKSREVSSSQLMTKLGQTSMKRWLEEGMATIRASYTHLGLEIGVLRDETIELRNDIGAVGNTMSSEMGNLQSRAEGIKRMTGIFFSKQEELLEGQSMAIHGLDFLTASQSEAIKEGNDALKKLAEFSRKQQRDLLIRHEQLQQAHDHLVESSVAIAAAQDVFGSKQADMLVALERLFTFYSAVQLESRVIKALFVYSISIFIIYMFTSTKQTSIVRPRLYMGLTVTFMVEVIILQRGTDDVERMLWIINMARSLFAFLASLQILHAVFTHRDYEILHHNLLVSLIEEVDAMQNERDLPCKTVGGAVNWVSWMHLDLNNEDDVFDPDYALPEQPEKSSTEKAVIVKYNLR